MNFALCGLGKAGSEFVRYMVSHNNLSDDKLCAVLCRNESITARRTVSDITKIVTPHNIVIQKISEFSYPGKLDVIIDFSASQTTFALVDLCIAKNINLVICPTDFSNHQLADIKKRVEKSDIGVVYAPTLTGGINILINFIEKFSSHFPDFNFEIVEKHPKRKSSPTRTAGYIAQAIDRPNIPIHSVRLDGFTGIHEITATNGYERITITHESFSRAAFVLGALHAARFISSKKGFFTVNEVYKEDLANNLELEQI